jgi:predicted tellurium resistance membrane protein TerC
MDVRGLERVGQAAARDAGGIDAGLLGGFLPAVLAATAARRRLRRRELQACAEAGRRAAARGIALRALVDLYLSAGWRLWRDVPEVATGDAERVRAAGFPHPTGAALPGRVERALQGRHGDAHPLVLIRSDELVCVFAAPDAAAVDLVRRIVADEVDSHFDSNPAAVTGGGAWRGAVSALFVFAAILLWSAYKLLREDDGDYDPSTNLAVRLVRRLLPVQDRYVGAKFLVKQAGKWVATPMLVVVVAIEAADLVFAVDSVPAVLAVSDDPFIVYSSNAFAILGLRALYFLLAGMLDRFHYLSKALAVILGFIGVKLILQAAHHTISTSVPEIPSPVSLVVIVVLLAGSVLLSLLRPPSGQDDGRPAVPALRQRR